MPILNSFVNLKRKIITQILFDIACFVNVLLNFIVIQFKSFKMFLVVVNSPTHTSSESFSNYMLILSSSESTYLSSVCLFVCLSVCQRHPQNYLKIKKLKIIWRLKKLKKHKIIWIQLKPLNVIAVNVIIHLMWSIFSNDQFGHFLVSHLKSLLG